MSSPDGTSGPDPLHTPAFARKVIITVGIVALAVLVLALLWQAMYVLLMIFGGILLAILLRAMADPIARYGRIPEVAALGIVVLVIIGGMVVFTMLMAPRIAEEMEQLAEQIPKALDDLKHRVVHYEWTSRLLEAAPRPDRMVEPPFGLIAQATGMVAVVAEAIVYVVVILFVGLYLAVSPQWYVNGLVRLAPLSRRPQVREALDEVGYTLRWWLIGRLIAMAAVGVMTWLGLLLIGVPLPLVLGFIAGLLDFIPNIGPIIAMVPALLLAFGAEDGGVEKVLYTLILYIVVQQVESLLITPLVQQKAIHMPPALTVSAQVLMGLMAGILGLTLATPIAAAAMVLVQVLYVRNTLGDKEMSKPSEDTS